MIIASAHEVISPVTTVVGVPMPDVAQATLGVFDLSDTGFVSEDPAVLVWIAAVSERGFVW